MVLHATGVESRFNISGSGAAWPTVITPTTTSSLPDGGIANISVMVDIPAGAKAGDSDDFTLTAVSTADPAQQNSLNFTTVALSKGWFQGYVENFPTTPAADTEAYLDSIHGFQQFQLSDTRDEEYQVAVSAFYVDQLVYAWDSYRSSVNDSQIGEVLFETRSVPDGAVLIPAVKVADHGLATGLIVDSTPAVAVDPRTGSIGVAWTRLERSRSTYYYNLYYAVYDPDGHVVRPPTPLTNNQNPNYEYYHIGIEAFRTGGFALAWKNTGTTDIYYALLDGDGVVKEPPALIAAGSMPRVVQLLDGNMLVIWHAVSHDKEQDFQTNDIFYAVISPNGEVVREKTNLSHQRRDESPAPVLDRPAGHHETLAAAMTHFRQFRGTG